MGLVIKKWDFEKENGTEIKKIIDDNFEGLNINKVDKIAGKSLINDSEIERLASVTNQSAEDLNLGNVDNTSDLDKPISHAQQEALNLKQPILTAGDNILIEEVEGNTIISSSGSGIISGGTKGQYLVKASENDFDVKWHSLPIEKYYKTQVDLVEGQPIEIILPTSITGTNLITKLFVNGVLEGIHNEGVIAVGNKITYTPDFTADNASILVIYGGDEFELPKNYQYVTVDFTIDTPNTTIENAFVASMSGTGSALNVDWGDGITEVLVASPSTINATHTYINAGTYEVKIVDDYGQMLACRFSTQSVKSVSKVKRFEGSAFTNLSTAFSNHTREITFAEGFRFETPNVTTLASMFLSANVPVVPADLFAVCTKVNSISGIFDKSTITALPTGLLNHMKEIDNANVMCRQCTNLVTVGDDILRGLPLLTAATSVFINCSSLETIGDYAFADNPLLGAVTSVFEGCVALKEIPKHTLTNCPNLTSIASFCYKVATDLILHEDLCPDSLELTNIAGFLRTATGITKIPSNLFRNNTKISEINLAFNGMTSCTDVPVDLLHPFLESVTISTSCFQGSNQFTTNINEMIPREMPLLDLANSTFYGCTKITGSGLELISKLTLPPSTNSGFFKTCTSLSDFASIPTSWK